MRGWLNPVAEHREVRYATPSLTRSDNLPGRWYVKAMPYGANVGLVEQAAAGWVALMPTARHAGLWPTKQAAAEVLVRQAGYELGEVGQL